MRRLLRSPGLGNYRTVALRLNASRGAVVAENAKFIVGRLREVKTLELYYFEAVGLDSEIFGRDQPKSTTYWGL